MDTLNDDNNVTTGKSVASTSKEFDVTRYETALAEAEALYKGEYQLVLEKCQEARRERTAKIQSLRDDMRGYGLRYMHNEHDRARNKLDSESRSDSTHLPVQAFESGPLREKSTEPYVVLLSYYLDFLSDPDFDVSHLPRLRELLSELKEKPFFKFVDTPSYSSPWAGTLECLYLDAAAEQVAEGALRSPEYSGLDWTGQAYELRGGGGLVLDSLFPAEENYRFRVLRLFSNKRKGSDYTLVKWDVLRALLIGSVILQPKALKMNIGDRVALDVHVESDGQENEDTSADMMVAILADKPQALAVLLKEMNERTGKSELDLIRDLKLGLFTAGNGCLKTLKYLLKVGMNLEQKVEVTFPNQAEMFLVTPLALAVHACQKLSRDDGEKLINVLLAAKANYNYRVEKKWTETRGYMDSKTVPMTKRVTLFDFDTTGLLSECVTAFRARNDTRQSAAASDRGGKQGYPNRGGQRGARRGGAQQHQAHGASRAASGDSLAVRVEQLEAENAVLRREMRDLRAFVESRLGDENAAASADVDAAASGKPGGFFQP